MTAHARVRTQISVLFFISIFSTMGYVYTSYITFLFIRLNCIFLFKFSAKVLANLLLFFRGNVPWFCRFFFRNYPSSPQISSYLSHRLAFLLLLHLLNLDRCSPLSSSGDHFYWRVNISWATFSVFMFSCVHRKTSTFSCSWKFFRFSDPTPCYTSGKR